MPELAMTAAPRHKRRSLKLLGREAGLTEDRAQRAALEIPIVKWNGDEYPRPVGVVATANVVHKKAGSLEGANKLARP
jgi:hypothetical protein